MGVRPGSAFHRTECFGPVLGVMAARDLDHAIELQNDTDFGLTGGIHSLDPHEISRWLERVEVGNAYVNRTITGAIVGRQPFGGLEALGRRSRGQGRWPGLRRQPLHLVGSAARRRRRSPGPTASLVPDAATRRRGRS